MSDRCNNFACQKEISAFNKQFYEEPNYEKLFYGYSKMEDVLKYIRWDPKLLKTLIKINNNSYVNLLGTSFK